MIADNTEISFKDVKLNLELALNNEKTGILLRSDKYIDANGQPVINKNAFFQLTSGIFRKEFITIWDLFDERELFKQCMSALSQMACDIREKTPFDIIVSCTPTAKELVSYIHSSVENVGPVQIRHFGDYPSLSLSYKEMATFQNAGVLIITDVVASANLVKRLGELINRLGGTVRAVLTVFDTQEEFEEVYNDNGLPIIEVGSATKKNKVMLHSLLHVPIHTYTDDEMPDNPVIRKIDLSVLPEIPVSENGLPLNIIPEMDAIKSFEKSNALDFGFFTSGPVGFSLALRLDRVLDNQGDDIWNHIRPHIDDDSVIATSFSKEDLRFFDFFSNRARNDKINFQSILIMKRGDSMAIPHLFCSSTEFQLKDKVVTLLISTVISSFKLENMVSLLAAEQVRAIKVICLVNRMGYHTTRFVKTINKLLTNFTTVSNSEGKCGEDYQIINYSRTKNIFVNIADTTKDFFNKVFQGKQNDSNFTFIPVYSITDIPSDDLLCMHRLVDSKIDRYLARGYNHPILSLFASQFSTNFDSRSVNELSFQNSLLTPLSEINHNNSSYTINPNDGGDPVTVNSLEAMIWLITYRIVAQRNYDYLIERISNETNIRALYHYFALLIADHNLLRIRRRFDRIIDLIITRLNESRHERIILESQNNDDINKNTIENRIRNAINVEVTLLSGLMLLADFGESSRFKDDFYTGILLANLPHDKWLELPINLKCHFTDERFVCLFSMIIHTYEPNFRSDHVKDKLKRQLYKKTRKIIKAFDVVQTDNRFGENENDRKAMFQKIKTFVDLIHREIGSHGQQEKHQLIRYLFRWILKWRDRHNPLLMDLDKALNDISSLFDLMEDSTKYTRKHIKSKETISRIDEAIDATNILIELGHCMRKFYMFTPTTWDIHKRYMTEGHLSGYAKDTLNIRKILIDVKNRRSITVGEKSKLIQLRTDIHQDFYDSSSAFRQSLTSYIVGFIKELRRNLVYASNRLSSLGMGDVWIAEINDIDNEFPNLQKNETEYSEWDVLADPYLFQTTIRNILFNIRHAFDPPKLNRPGIDPVTGNKFSDLVKIKIRKDQFDLHLEDSSKDFVQLDVLTKGRPFRPEDLAGENTFANQQAQIKEYGGALEIQNDPEDGFTSQVSLRLLNRKEFFKGVETEAKPSTESED
jgi:orotate phosphoribosyltransferase